VAEIIESAAEIGDRKMGGRKIATLDIGGTLVDSGEKISSHAKINKALGMAPEEEKRIYEQYEGKNGDIQNHRHHAYDRTQALEGREEANIENYAKIVQEILDGREVIEGAPEFIETLQDQNYTTIALSSTPPAATRPQAEELGIDYIYKWKDFEFYEDGGFARIYVSPEGENGKQDVIKAFQQQGAEVIHFGNGANDLEAINQADAGFRQFWTSNPENAYEWARKEAAKL